MPSCVCACGCLSGYTTTFQRLTRGHTSTRLRGGGEHAFRDAKSIPVHSAHVPGHPSHRLHLTSLILMDKLVDTLLRLGVMMPLMIPRTHLFGHAGPSCCCAFPLFFFLICFSLLLLPPPFLSKKGGLRVVGLGKEWIHSSAFFLPYFSERWRG